MSEFEDRLLSGLQLLAADEPVRFRVIGGCMDPLVRHGDEVEVCRTCFYWPGDLVAFRSAGGRILLHRLLGFFVRRRRLHLITQGDSRNRPDAPVPVRDILGRVTGGSCSTGAARPILAHRWRALARLARLAWRWLRPE